MNGPRLRAIAGALLYDVPRFAAAAASGRWWTMRNRREHVSSDGRGVRCEWTFTSDLHIAEVFPRAGVQVLHSALGQWPIAFRDAPRSPGDVPRVSFVIGHRGTSRAPHLLATLRSIAGQEEVPVECIVVEQSLEPEVRDALPPWVRYVHTRVAPADSAYNRAATLNAGSEAARGDIVVLHDNDMLVPSRYAAELIARRGEGHLFIELKRFTFYLDPASTASFFAMQQLPAAPRVRIVQNLLGASVAADREAYFAIGGFDEEFVGWGGEDNDFWDRAETAGRTYRFGYLPFVHLHHDPQPGKLMGDAAPAVRRYREIESVPPDERIRRLLAKRRG